METMQALIERADARLKSDEVVGKDGLVLRKEPGTLPFRIVQTNAEGWPKEQMVRRFATRKLASAFLGAMRGDKQAAHRWYRETIAKDIKDTGVYKTPSDAWHAAAQDAHLMGWSPAFVGADPNTFEPLGQVEHCEWVGSPLAERADAYMRHCVAGVTKGGKDKGAAFAICKAGGNKAGYYTPGTKQQTAKGRRAIRAHGRDAAAKTKDAAYKQAIKGEGTMTGMRKLIEAAEAQRAWGAGEEKAFKAAVEAQMRRQGLTASARVDVSAGVVDVDTTIAGKFNRMAGKIVIEAGRARGAKGSQVEAGAWFYPKQGRPQVVVAIKPIPQTLETSWPPDPQAFGAEAGDMIAQVYEMAMREGFAGNKE